MIAIVAACRLARSSERLLLAISVGSTISKGVSFDWCWTIFNQLLKQSTLTSSSSSWGLYVLQIIRNRCKFSPLRINSSMNSRVTSNSAMKLNRKCWSSSRRMHTASDACQNIALSSNFRSRLNFVIALMNSRESGGKMIPAITSSVNRTFSAAYWPMPSRYSPQGTMMKIPIPDTSDYTFVQDILEVYPNMVPLCTRVTLDRTSVISANTAWEPQASERQLTSVGLWFIIATMLLNDK